MAERLPPSGRSYPLHFRDSVAIAGSSYEKASRRLNEPGVGLHVAMHPGNFQALDKNSTWSNLLDKAEQLQAIVRA